MSKTSPEELVDETKEQLIAFLAKGGINERELSNDLDFAGVEIDDFRRIKRVHFVLSDPVVKFVTELPRRIRKIKRESQRSRELSRGKVEGKIDWGATIKRRNSQSYGDNSLFVCDTPYVEYNIPENLVLKKLLAIIHDTIETDVRRIDYDWRTERWDEDLVKEMRYIFERNIHVNRIRDPDDIQLRQRDLSAARQSRNALYYKAYELYDTYQRLMANDFEGEEMKELLEQTLVEPNDTPTLFEYFCVFKLIESLLSEYEGLAIQPINANSDEIAKLDGDGTKIKIFRDRQGSFTIKETLEGIDRPLPTYLARYEQVIDDHVELAQETVDRNPDRAIFSGRPDIVVEIYDTADDGESLTKLMLGEVKYSNKEQTFSDGLKELLKYMKFIRDNDEYLQDTLNSVQGVLMVDSVEFTAPDREDIRITNTDRMMDKERLSD